MHSGDSLPGAAAGDRLDEILSSALAAAEDEQASPTDRTEMLISMAIGLQNRPKTVEHLEAAVTLYDAALRLCPLAEELLAARIRARKGTALQAIPSQGVEFLEQARDLFRDAIPSLTRLGRSEELAEAEMNLGLALQQLAERGRAPISEAIAAYQRSLRTFDAKRYPVEYAILQNNLATAFLLLPMAGERAKIREALAVQCFEQALKVINLIEHPSEYAMLQNNLGNALQYAASGHPVENNLRAIAAYDEALQVRNPANAPVEYANTISNKANCLWNLPDDPEHPERGNPANMQRARGFYAEARGIFLAHGEEDRARMVAELLAQLDGELRSGAAG